MQGTAGRAPHGVLADRVGEAAVDAALVDEFDGLFRTLEVGERDDEDLGDLARVGSERGEVAEPPHHGDHEDAAHDRVDRRERAEDLDEVGRDPELLLELAEGGPDGTAVPRVGEPARERDLAGMPREVLGAAGEHDRRLRRRDDGDEDARRNRLGHRRRCGILVEDGAQARAEVVARGHAPIVDEAPVAEPGGILADVETAGAVIEVTERAARKVRSLAEREGTPDACLRVRVIAGGCSGYAYRLGFEPAPATDDAVVEAHGVRVLVDPESAAIVEGSTLDLDASLLEGGLKMRNPRARSECACGDSFDI